MFVRFERRSDGVSIDKYLFFKNSNAQDSRVLDKLQIKNAVIKFNFTIGINESVVQIFLKQWIEESDFYEDSFSQMSSPCRKIFRSTNPVIYSGETRNIGKLIKFGFREVLNEKDDELRHYHLHEIGVNVRPQEKEDNIEIKYKHNQTEQTIILNFHLKRNLEQSDINLILLSIKKNLEEFYGLYQAIRNAEKVNVFNYQEYGYAINLKSQRVYEEFMMAVACSIMHSAARGPLTPGEQYVFAVLHRDGQGGIETDLDKAVELFYKAAKHDVNALKALEYLADHGCATAKGRLKMYKDEQQLVITTEEECREAGLLTPRREGVTSISKKSTSTTPPSRVSAVKAAQAQSILTPSTSLIVKVVPSITEAQVSKKRKTKSRRKAKVQVTGDLREPPVIMTTVDDAQQLSDTDQPKILLDALQKPAISAVAPDQQILLLKSREIALKFRQDSANPKVAADAHYSELVKKAISLQVHLEQSSNGNTAFHWTLISKQSDKAILLLQEIETLDHQDAVKLLEIQNNDRKTVLAIFNELRNSLSNEIGELIEKILNDCSQERGNTDDRVELTTRKKAGSLPKVASTASPRSSNILQCRGSVSHVTDVNKFLDLVAQGWQDQAEEMLKQNPILILAAGDVNDLAGRSFKGVHPEIARLSNNGERWFRGITAFQYAVWALDVQMWEMLFQYLNKYPGAAFEQAQMFESGSWVAQYGAHAGYYLKRLITALEVYQDKFMKPGTAEAQEHWWIQRVGGAQLLSPAHIINRYCYYRHTVSGEPLPSERSRAVLLGHVEYDDVFSARLKGGGGLGSGFGLCRYLSDEVDFAIGCEHGTLYVPVILQEDRDFFNQCIQKRSDLISEFSKKHLLKIDNFEQPKYIRLSEDCTNTNGMSICGIRGTFSALSFYHNPAIIVNITIGYDKPTDQCFMYVERLADAEYPESISASWVEGFLYDSLKDEQFPHYIPPEFMKFIDKMINDSENVSSVDYPREVTRKKGKNNEGLRRLLAVFEQYKIYISIEIYKILANKELCNPDHKKNYSLFVQDVSNLAYSYFKEDSEHYYKAFYRLIDGLDYNDPLDEAKKDDIKTKDRDPSANTKSLTPAFNGAKSAVTTPTVAQAALQVAQDLRKLPVIMTTVGDAQQLSDTTQSKNFLDERQKPVVSAVYSEHQAFLLKATEIALKLRQDSANPKVAADAHYGELVKKAIALRVHLEKSSNGNTALHWIFLNKQVDKAILFLKEIATSDHQEAAKLLEIQNNDGKTVLTIFNDLRSILPHEIGELIEKSLNNCSQDVSDIDDTLVVQAPRAFGIAQQQVLTEPLLFKSSSTAQKPAVFAVKPQEVHIRENIQNPKKLEIMTFEQLLSLSLAEHAVLETLKLKLSSNGILGGFIFSMFCEALTQCYRLKTLDLSENNLGRLQFGELERLGASLARCGQLQVLDLSSNDFGSSSFRFQSLCTGLSQCHTLQTLGLSGNNLGHLQFGELERLGASLARCGQLQVLDLSSNDFGSSSFRFQSLCTGLSQCHTLQTLGLSGNNLGHLQFGELERLGASLARCGQLQVLDLSSNDFGSSSFRFQSLCTGLSQCHTLQTLGLSGNNLGRLQFGELERLGASLARCGQLQVLNLSSNDFGSSSFRFQSLCAGLSQCYTLQTLGLSGNNLGRLQFGELECLGASLARCGQLQVLNLSGNDFGSSSFGFQILCNRLAQCHSLQMLDLSRNNLSLLGSGGLEILHIILRQCYQLKKLSLKNNELEHFNDNLFDSHHTDVILIDNITTAADTSTSVNSNFRSIAENIREGQFFVSDSNFERARVGKHLKSQSRCSLM